MWELWMEGAELPYSSNIYQGRESDNVRIISFRTHTNEILQIVQCISLLPPVFPDSPDLEVPLVPADADDREAGGVHHHHHHLVSGPVPRPAPPAPSQDASKVKTTRAESRGGARGSVARAGQQGPGARLRHREMLSGPRTERAEPRVMFPPLNV